MWQQKYFQAKHIYNSLIGGSRDSFILFFTQDGMDYFTNYRKIHTSTLVSDKIQIISYLDDIEVQFNLLNTNGRKSVYSMKMNIIDINSMKNADVYETRWNFFGKSTTTLCTSKFCQEYKYYIKCMKYNNNFVYRHRTIHRPPTYKSFEFGNVENKDEELQLEIKFVNKERVVYQDLSKSIEAVVIEEQLK